MERYQYFTLSDDFMFINDIPFFITISHHIKYITDLMAKDQSIKTVIKTAKETKSHCAKCGFCIKGMWMNRQLE